MRSLGWRFAETRTVLAVKIIAIGGSAGAISALRRLLPTLRADLDAAVVITIHRQPVEEDERLPRVIGNHSKMPVAHAADGERLKAGRIYLAPANVHLSIIDERARLLVGPRENYVRPAIDVLFRAAAHNFGRRALAILLSGFLDDGVAGLSEIKAHGGTTIVQSPDDATFGDMPRNGIAIGVHAVLAIEQMATEIDTFVSRADDAPAATAADVFSSTASTFSCPDCHGVMSIVEQNGMAFYRCRTGHSYAPESFAIRASVKGEEAVWAAVRSLEELAEICEATARRLEQNGDDLAASRLRERGSAAVVRSQFARQALPNVEEALAWGATPNE